MGIFDYNNYHLIGIGGIGISAIARMLCLRGKIVTGSDSSQSEITDNLAKLGIKIFIGQKANNIQKYTEVVIYTVAIGAENPELKEVRKRKITCLSYPEALGELSKNMFTIAVSGTHGKTTTTAMIGHILKKAKLDPTIIVGSKMLSTGEKSGSNFLAGKSKYLVVEACEYKRSFLNLHPQILIITNIEADHLDYYKDIEDIKNAFKEMASKVPSNGIVVRELDYKKVSVPIKLLIPGDHNISNAKAAIKAVETLGIANEQASEYLKDFKGTWRRLEYKGQENNKGNGNVFYDDYAHHPTEIKASLLALREKYPDRMLVCVFEPHQQSRTKLFFNDFVEALKSADRVFIAPIFVTREIDDRETTNKKLADVINKTIPASPISNPAELKTLLKKIDANRPLCIVFMGAGNIYKWTSEVLNQKN